LTSGSKQDASYGGTGFGDQANRDDQTQERFYREAQAALSRYENKTVFIRDFSTEAAKQIPDGSLDYVYIDARHDFCSVYQDLTTYWRKVRDEGIMAGHDYDSLPRWSTCPNGTVEPSAVKGAVNKFVTEKGVSSSMRLTVKRSTDRGTSGSLPFIQSKIFPLHPAGF